VLSPVLKVPKSTFSVQGGPAGELHFRTLNERFGTAVRQAGHG
jgi:hypothetical protein